VTGSDELYLLAERELPDAGFYGDFPQSENGVGAVTLLRKRVREGLAQLPRLDGKRVAVITGSAMSPIMPPLLELLTQTTGAHFELIPVVNSLFGKTVTTAGLLVGADIERALAGRTDVDFALMPAETLNDDSRFLDDRTFLDVRESVACPLYASYDFIDALSAEPVSAGVA
jgi:NifB/MoaA-like Fe-S oxidoreductase